MPGGTSFYCSHAIRHFKDVDFKLVTAVADSELQVTDDLQRKGINVKVIRSDNSVFFENIYDETDPNSRTQRVLAKADPFRIEHLEKIDAKIYLLGALLADDFPKEMVKYLATKGLVAIDSQGYLREVRNNDVFAIDWIDKLEVLQHVHFLKANEHEMKVLTGHDDVRKGAQQLFDWGVKEVLITLGSFGSVIYDGNTFFVIPAYLPAEVVDSTGCGDTYLTGYLYQRAKGIDIASAGRFAAAMATIKIEVSGPFYGSKEDVLYRIHHSEQTIPTI